MAKYKRKPHAVHAVKTVKDGAAVRMDFEKKRKEKQEHRNQMLKEWKLGQAQNLKDTYSSMIVRPEHLAAKPHIKRARDQLHNLLKREGALRQNRLPL